MPREKPAVVNHNIRFPAELHRQLAELAEREHRSLNGQIIHMLTLALENTAPKGN